MKKKEVEFHIGDLVKRNIFPRVEKNIDADIGIVLKVRELGQDIKIKTVVLTIWFFIPTKYIAEYCSLYVIKLNKGE